jgi:hypothetical protein
VIDPNHLCDYVIRPVDQFLGMWSVDSERLVLGTICQESECGRWLKQLGGPALGICQMEPETHDDCYIHFLDFNPDLKNKVMALSSSKNEIPDSGEMIGNLNYSVAMCRIKYYRDPYPIPSTLEGQAEYWKRVYNTHEGAGMVEDYVENWHRFITGVV